MSTTIWKLGYINFFDIPYIVEIFFGISTIIFVIAIYAILPAFQYEKRTLFKPSLINSLWRKSLNEIVKIPSLIVRRKKKKHNEIFLTINNEGQVHVNGLSRNK